MTQLIPEKILEIIDDHDRAEKKQRNKIGFIYLCLCLAIRLHIQSTEKG
uniref:Uncharacterized protein n=1 Tax=Escherichia coli TaxID=562 RepID=A0A160HRJ3_ECOLX|nr:hypothetical protein [Escherichia coli]